MKDSLILEGKNYISARRAHEVTGYTSDYIGQLCRGGKLDCKMVGRGWFVTEDSIVKHKISNSDPIISRIVSKKENKKDEIKDSLKSEEIKPVEIEKLEKKEIVTKNVFKYDTDKSPLLPLLKKIEFSKRTEPVSFVPSIFSIPNINRQLVFSNGHYFGNGSNLTLNTFSGTVSKSLHTKNKNENLIPIFIMILVIGAGSFFLQGSMNIFGRLHISSSQASVYSVSKNIVDSVVYGFEGVVNRLGYYLGINMFSSKFAVNYSNINNSNSSLKNNEYKSDSDFRGIAVVPSTNSKEKDERVKDRIRSSFSDEVQVHPDESGTAGIITPVFRKATGDNFVYVLVPVPEKRQ